MKRKKIYILLFALSACTSAPVGEGTLSTPAARTSAAALSSTEKPLHTLLIAGDIADCRNAAAPQSAAAKTAALVEAALHADPNSTAITLGDNTYPNGTQAEFTDCYEPTWGRFKQRTRPSPGNHDYLTENASGYYDYFGAIAGPDRRGYYSYDIAGWHIVSLNSNIDAEESSAQIKWLREDLLSHPARCTIAYWHHPLFTSGRRGNNLKMKAAWQMLQKSGAEIILSGHDHHYERFAPQDAEGVHNEKQGLRELLVGTGGVGLTPPDVARTNSEVRDSSTHGVIKLALYDNAYRWEFVPVAGGSYSDSGTGVCH